MANDTNIPTEDNDKTHGKRVQFIGPDFMLSMVCEADAADDDETLVNDAAEWFLHQYGFNPAAVAEEVSIEQIY